jgi:glycine betaine/proline transport system permease protein
MPRIYVGNGVSTAINWLLANLSGLFDAIATVTSHLVNWVGGALGLPVWAMIVIFTIWAFLASGPGLAIFTVLAFLLIDSMRLWTQTMQTLSVVLVAALIATVIGVPLGVWAARRPLVGKIIRPVLDFMQTLPVFVYLIPAVFFFGIGVVPGVVATMIFAIPPAVRLTELGIRQVDRETVEAAEAFGSAPGQILRQVQLPLALPSIMAGINQVIMLALSMVVVAGLVGAAGLGSTVVRSVTQLDVAGGFEGGIAVVILAIYLDRLTAALAAPRRRTPARRPSEPASPAEASPPAAENTLPVPAARG